jgi:hypothetical protein
MAGKTHAILFVYTRGGVVTEVDNRRPFFAYVWFSGMCAPRSMASLALQASHWRAAIVSIAMFGEENGHYRIFIVFVMTLQASVRAARCIVRLGF